MYSEIVTYNKVSDWLEEHFCLCVYFVLTTILYVKLHKLCTKAHTYSNFNYCIMLPLVLLYRDYFMVSLVSLDRDTNTWNVEGRENTC